MPGPRRNCGGCRDKLGCTAEDALVVVWGVERDTLCAAEEIRLRYADACVGVPPETRQPFADGSTSFERILPGPDRMYPDTDSPPQRILRERVSQLAAGLPEPPWLREARFRQAGVPRHTVHYLIRRGGAQMGGPGRAGDAHRSQTRVLLLWGTAQRPPPQEGAGGRDQRRALVRVVSRSERPPGTGRCLATHRRRTRPTS